MDARYGQYVGGRAIARAAVLVGLGLFAVVSPMGVVRVRADDDPVTDLPFFTGTKEVNCGWHNSCAPGNETDGDGFDLDMETGDLITAAADGVVIGSMENPMPFGDSEVGFGVHVTLDHGGSYATLYGHLASYMPPTTGIEMCRYTALGYAGSSGHSTGAHLHFKGYGPDRLTPIFGSRPTAEYDENAFNPAKRYPTTVPWVSHSCGPRDGLDCRLQTAALTVDDNQSTSWPKTCQNCDYDEFDLLPWYGDAMHENHWDHVDRGGFGYGNKSTNGYYAAPLVDDVIPVLTAKWYPHLEVADSNWSVYAYIPGVDGEDDTPQFARAVHYWIDYCKEGDPHNGCLRWSVKEKVIDQYELSTSAKTQNRWIELWREIPSPYPSGGSHWGPIMVRADNHKVGACNLTTDPCQGQVVAIDALMFVPSNCD